MLKPCNKNMFLILKLYCETRTIKYVIFYSYTKHTSRKHKLSFTVTPAFTHASENNLREREI